MLRQWQVGLLGYVFITNRTVLFVEKPHNACTSIARVVSDS